MRTLYDTIRRDYVASGQSTNALRIFAFYRIGHALLIARDMPRPIQLIALSILRRLQKWFVYYPFHIEMPLGCEIGPGLRLVHLHDIVISPSARIGSDCTIYHGVTIGANEHRRAGQPAATIGDGVYIGAGAKIIGPVHIGDGAIIGANAVVVRDVAVGVTVTGSG